MARTPSMWRVVGGHPLGMAPSPAMRMHIGRLALTLLTAGALALGGCSSHDEITVDEATEKLVVDCEQVRFGDRAACRCLADELRMAGHSGPQIDALREAINFGTRRFEVTEAASACAAKRANEGQ